MAMTMASTALRFLLSMDDDTNYSHRFGYNVLSCNRIYVVAATFACSLTLQFDYMESFGLSDK